MQKRNALVYSVFVLLLMPAFTSAGSIINRRTGNVNWNTASTWIQARTGTATFTNGSINVSGTGTAFTTELQVGDVLMLQGSPATVRGTVATILSNTSLRLASGASGSGSGTYGRQAVPSSTDDVTIGNPLLASTTTVTLNTASATVNSLTLAAGSRSNRLIHSGTNALTVSAGVIVAQPTNNNRTNEWRINGGTGLVGGSLSIGGTNTTTTRISRVTLTTGLLDVSGNLTFNSPASVAGVAVVNLSGGAGQLRIGGNLTLTNGSGTLTPGTTSTVVFDGSGSQAISGGSAITFYHLTVDKSAGTATPGSNLTVGGNLTVTAGTFSLGAFTANRTTAGGTLSVGAGATLGIGGTNGFPSNYSTVSLNASSTVVYDGAAQTIATLTYGNLTLGGTGVKSLPVSSLSLGGNFLLTGSASATAQGALTVAGNFTIDAGASFNAAAFTHQIRGNWSNGGTFTPSGGTMVMNGSAPQSMSGSVFNNLTINNASDVTMLTDETVNGTLSVVSGRLLTGGNTVHLGPSATLAEAPGATVRGIVTTMRSVSSTSGTESFGGIGAAITLHGTAPGATTVTRTTGTAASGNGHNSILRTFDIAPAVNSGLFADLTYRYDYTELNGQNAVSLGLFKSTDNGSTWKDKAGVSDTAAKTVAVYGLDGFSDWTAADAANSLGAPASPVVSGISPSTKNMGDGAFTLTVDGTEFVGGLSVVRFAGSDRATSYINEHQLTASVSAADLAYPGMFEITAYTAGAGSSNPESLTVTPDTMTISASASAGGSISPAGTVSVVYGTNQSFSVTANTGYHIDSVVVDGVNLGAVASHAFNNVTANHAIDAYFSIDVFTVTASASAGGNISPSGSVNVNYGANQSFSITPNTGYHTDSVVVDGVNLGAVASHDFNNVTANHSIDAYFSIDVFTVTATASAGGSISPTGVVSVNYGVNQSFSITPNTGYHIDSVVVDGVNLGVVSSHDFNNVTANHSINAYFSIDVFTVIATASAGGNISPSGSVNVNYGANQSFSISPNTGYHIDSVVVDAINLGVVASHDFNNVTASHSIDAYFSIDVFTVIATASAGGSISPAGTVSVNYGSNQSFSITPNTGYHTDSVVVDGVNLGAVASHDFNNVTTNHSIDAYFSIDVFTVTATASAGGSMSPTGVVNVNYGANQSFSITPNTGYHTDSVVVDGVNLGAVASHDFNNVTTNHSIDAYFSIDVFTVTATASAGGSISPTGVVNVNYGANQSFSVTPNTGYHIDSVIVDGVNLGAVASHDFNNVTANHSIDAYFSIDVFTVIATASAGGSISPAGTVSVNYGSNQSFSITPNTGYHTDSVVVDGVNLGAVAGHDFNNVTANHSIDAYFSIDVFTVIATASAGGSISPTGVVSVNYDADQSFSVTPNTGYHTDSVVVDGVNLGVVASHDFNNVTANHAIDSYFSIDVFTVTATASAGGSVSPAGAVSVNYGSNQSFSITPNTGYHIDSVVVDGVNLGAVAGHDFNNVTANHAIDSYFSIDVFTVTATASAGGSISPSGSVNVHYGANQTFSVTPNTGYHTDSVVVDGVNLGVVASHDFNNVTTHHSIDAYFSIDVFTVMAIASAGGSISPSGSVNVHYGANQTFSVTPNTGYHTDSVVVDGVNLGVVASHDFNNVTTNHAIDAYFSIDVFTVIATASAGGSISPSGSVNVNYGANQSFSISPNTGYHIDSVIVDGVNVGAVASHDFNNVTTNHFIDSYFSIDVFTVTATASAGGSVSPAGTVSVNYGSNQSFSITPNTGYHTDSVVVDGVNLGAVASHDFNNVTTNHSIDAYFSIDVFTVTATASAGGSISPTGVVNVNYGANQSFSVTPNTGYHIDSVIVDGVNLGAVASHDFNNVTANHSIDAYFSIDVFTVTATASAGGSISPTGVVNVNYGANQSFSVTPNTGYHIDSVIVDGVNLGAVASHDFNNVTANHSIDAYFSIDVFTVTATASAGGSINPIGVVNVNYGVNQSFSISPSTGYHIDSVIVDGVNLGAVASHDFNNVTANHAIDSYFSIDVFTVTATASAGGSVSPAGAVNVNYGSNQSFSISPNTGYHIDSLVVDGVNLGAVVGHDFNNVTANHSIDAYFSIDVFTVTATASAGGSISPTGVVTVNYDANQSFSVTPNTGYHTDSVVVDGVNLSVVASHDFNNVTANHSIDAYFSIDVSTVTATASAGGSVSPTGVVNVNYGSNQSFSISPNTGYHIDSVIVDGVNVGAVASHDFNNVTTNHAIDSYFSIDVFTVTATASAGGSISPTGVVTVNYDANQSFSVTPNTGYHTDSVVVDGVNLSVVASHDFNNVTADHSIDAYFSIDVFTVTATASAGGSVSPTGVVNVNYGSNQSFSISPNTGYHIDSVVVDAINLGVVASHDFNNVTASHSIDAYFSINVYTITATASAGGSILPPGSLNVNHGANQSYLISPNTGYHTDSVVVDGVNQGVLANYNFLNVTATHSIAAYFSVDVFTVTATASAGGSVSPTGVVSVNYGSNQSFSISPNAGYHIDSVVVDGVNLGVVASHDFNNVTADHSIDAYFSIDVFTVTATASAGGNISPSGSVNVNYGSNQSFSISPNTGYHIDSVVVDGLNLGVVSSHDFNNVTTNHAIEAYFSIDVFTITATTSAGGSISPTGAISVNYGANQSFSVTPNTGYHIDSVVVDGVNLGVVASHDVNNVTANHSIDAYFSIDVFTITATASAGGSISPTGAVSVNHGSNQSFSISPNTGYHIDSVVVDGVNLGAAASHNFTNVTANHVIAGYFSINSYTITATASSGGTISPSGTTALNYGGSQAFTVIPNTGSHIDSVVVDGVNQGAEAGHTFTNVTADHTIDAYFSINVYTVTASASTGGSITPAGPVNVNYGANRSFTISANTGYHIDSVVVDGANQGVVNGYSFTNVTSNHTVAAHFSINVFTITATATPGGSISPSGTVNISYGGNQTFSVSPNTGYHIDSVVVDGVNQGAVGVYGFSGVTASHTIGAFFSINVYTITANSDAGGTISPSGAVQVTHGGNRAFVITASTGSHLDSVVVDGTNQGAVTNYSFTNVTTGHSILAYFSINVFTITASASSGGSISPSGTINVNYGGGQSFGFTSNTGYHLDSVVVDGVNQGVVPGYTFVNVTANHAVNAYFSINVYTITASATPGGSISPSGAVNVNHGSNRSFSITANTGSHIDSVVVDGVSRGAIGSFNFTNVTAAHTIAAYFSINVLTITASATAGGAISPSGTVSVNYGANRSFSVTPNAGHHVDSVVVDGVNQGAVAGYTFITVTTAHSIASYFSRNTYPIMASAGPGGSITPSGTVNVTDGASQMFAVSADTGFLIDSVIVDGAYAGTPSSYTFTGVSGPHSIRAVFLQYTFSYEVVPEWNLLSVPQLVPDRSVAAVYPQATATVYAFDPSGYVGADSIDPGTGYWVKFPEDQPVAIDGLPVAVDTIPVSARWNLIGSVAVPVSVDDVVQDPPANVMTEFFGYDEGYTITDSIMPGRAYWVKTAASGRFILNGQGPAAAPKASTARRAHAELEPFNKLEFATSSTVSRTTNASRGLWFGPDPEATVDPGRFEMPPVPPAGVFDVRFGSQSNLAIVPDLSAGRWEIPVLIASARSTMEVRWTMNAADPRRYELIGKKGNAVTFRATMGESGSARIEAGDGTTYVLAAGTVPASHALAQNYPNPFNPSTTISFDLPADGRVRLEVYNVIGELVSTLIADEAREAGTHATVFDATGLPSGVYFYKIQAGGFSAMRKMVLLR